MYKTTAPKGFDSLLGDYGSARWNRTTSSGHEPDELPLLHQRDIFKARYVAFSIPKTDASNELLSVPFLV